MIDHHCHDYKHLVRRWRAVAAATGLRLHTLASIPGYKLHYLKSKSAGDGGLYLSAGIHGDEPGAPEALVTWAEKSIRLLPELPCIIFPCLNPWGLVNNRRSDQENRDLNRSFHHDDLAVITAVKTLIKPMKFSAALMLHEDYDGQGIYLYETERAKPFWGEQLLDAARKVIPVDPRLVIDGRKVLKPGLARRKVSLKIFEKIGMPEAIHLHLFHSERTFTIETPSEYSLPLRVAAHVAVIEKAVKLILNKK